MPTIDLTDDELAAVTAAVRRTIETDRFPRAPRLYPLRAALGKLEAEAKPTPPRRPRRRPKPTSAGERRRSALDGARVTLLIHYGMYVRWQTYRSQALNPWLRECNDRRARLKAVLVKSVRVSGKPRQRHIAFLGSLELDDPRMIGGDSDNARFWRRMRTNGKARFWRDVTARFDQLGGSRSAIGVDCRAGWGWAADGRGAGAIRPRV